MKPWSHDELICAHLVMLLLARARGELCLRAFVRDCLRVLCYATTSRVKECTKHTQAPPASAAGLKHHCK